MTTAVPTEAARPRTGVAMCVFNGARYLPEQLESITAQTQLPDHMAIIDDSSSDGGWELLQRWASTAPFSVSLRRNDRNVGVVRNFENAARMLLDKADIVFFSDQDDVWRPGKVAAFLDAFAADPGVGLVHSDADLVDSDGRALGMRLFAALRVTDRERQQVAAGRAWRAYVKRNLVTGAACACRSDVLARALPFPATPIHDDWISFTAGLVSRVKMLDEPLMAYRLHGSNTVGLPIPDLLWRLRAVVRSVITSQSVVMEGRLARLLEMRAQAQRLDVPADVIACLEQAIEHARHRTMLPRAFHRRLLPVLAQWRSGQYGEWSGGVTSVLHDLLVGT